MRSRATNHIHFSRNYSNAFFLKKQQKVGYFILNFLFLFAFPHILLLFSFLMFVFWESYFRLFHSQNPFPRIFCRKAGHLPGFSENPITERSQSHWVIIQTCIRFSCPRASPVPAAEKIPVFPATVPWTTANFQAFLWQWLMFRFKPGTTINMMRQQVCAGGHCSPSWICRLAEGSWFK